MSDDGRELPACSHKNESSRYELHFPHIHDAGCTQHGKYLHCSAGVCSGSTESDGTTARAPALDSSVPAL